MDINIYDFKIHYEANFYLNIGRSLYFNVSEKTYKFFNF